MQRELREVIRPFMALGRVKAGELLLPPPNALELIDCLERAREVVNGIDVWYLIDDVPVESTLYLPLSELGGVEENAALARQFLTETLPGILKSGEAPEIPSVDLVSVGFSSMFSVVDSLLS